MVSPSVKCKLFLTLDTAFMLLIGRLPYRKTRERRSYIEINISRSSNNNKLEERTHPLSRSTSARGNYALCDLPLRLETRQRILKYLVANQSRWYSLHCAKLFQCRVSVRSQNGHLNRETKNVSKRNSPNCRLIPALRFVCDAFRHVAGAACAKANNRCEHEMSELMDISWLCLSLQLLLKNIFIKQRERQVLDTNTRNGPGLFIPKFSLPVTTTIKNTCRMRGALTCWPAHAARGICSPILPATQVPEHTERLIMEHVSARKKKTNKPRQPTRFVAAPEKKSYRTRPKTQFLHMLWRVSGAIENSHFWSHEKEALSPSPCRRQPETRMQTR